MTVIDLLVLALFAALSAGTLYFLARGHMLWRLMLVALVLALSGLMLWWPGRYGPDERLKPGLDLAGGTTLVYDVRVPPDADAEQVINDLIAVLRDRVDPTGTRNLVWRQVAGNRIEIQMALATADTAEAREAFIAARDQLLANNLTRQEIGGLLRAAADRRPALIAQMAAGNEDLAAKLRQVVEAHEALTAATEPYQQAQEQYRQIEAQLDALPADASAEQRQTLEQQRMELLRQLAERTQAYNAARQRFEQLQNQVLESSITPTELERVLDLSPEVPVGETVSPRAAALEELKEAHPDRAEQIEQVAAAWAAYERVKGPLDDPNDLIALLRGSGVLEFRIAATPGELPNEQTYREQLEEQGPRAGAGQPWRWYAVDDIESFADTPEAKDLLAQSPEAYFASMNLVGQRYGDEYYVLLADTPDRAITREQEHWELTQVRRSVDELGQNAIDFRLNPAGGSLMGRITGASVGKPMAILLDNQVISAPTLNSKINDRGQITGGRGGFSDQELSSLLRTLKAGSTEAELGDYPISIKTTGPTLGEDNLRSGLRAAIISLVAVAVFMLVYYFFAGLVANFALVANMIVILGVMSLIEATWTLPGIAGLVLTIGMAVDANVLIFERIREELERKVDLATAVRLGYEKALSTIIDANITTLITCVVLGYTATAEVKGFAVTLGIGILATLFTALFGTRIIFDLFLHYGKAKSLAMLPTVVPAVRRALSPNVDWLGKRPIFVSISVALVVLGLAMIYTRGRDMLDIEFRSGTQVTFELAEGETLPIREVRQRLRDYAEVGAMMQRPGFDPAQLNERQRAIYRELRPILEDAERRRAAAEAAPGPDEALDEPLDLSLLAGATPVTVGATESTERGVEATSFSVATLITDSQAVSAVVKSAFSDVLDTTRPIDFAAADVEDVEQAPVYPIRSRDLGVNINRPDAAAHDVSDYLGGVAIVLDNLQPAATVEDLQQRVRRMRMQPAFEELGYRPFDVIGLDPAPNDPARYQSAVVVVRDPQVNYLDNPEAFTEPTGLAATEWTLVRDALQRDTSLASVSNFSSQVSATMTQQALAAVGLSLLAVVIYIWFRFGSLRYGVAAIAALVHDVTVALGAVAVSAFLYDNVLGQFLLLDPFKIDLAMIAAVLTIIGYSLNDTIIVFDRIRENRGRLARATPAILNDSINQTISRTVITSGTTLLAILILYIFGGTGVHGFAFAMLIGVGVGTYSSIAVAAPLLLIGYKRHVEQAAAKPGAPAGKKTPAPAAG